MSIVSFARNTMAGSGWMRSAFAQSTATSTSSAMSSGSERRSSPNGMNAYSRGTGDEPARYMAASLPSWRNASVVASSDPSASPSGFSWVTTRKRSRSRNAAAVACRSVAVCVISGCELVDQPAHPDAALDRRIVLEGQLGGPLEPQLPGDPRLQHAVGRLQPAHRRAPLLLGAEHADEDDRVPEIRRRVDPRHSHEPDPRVLELGQRLREDLPDGLVHT